MRELAEPPKPIGLRVSGIRGKIKGFFWHSVGKIKGFFWHSVLRRPWQMDVTMPGQSGKLLDCIILSFGITPPQLHVKVTQRGEPVLLEMTIRPRTQENVILKGVHGCYGEKETTISVSAPQKFRLDNLSFRFMLPAFRRIDGMIVYYDKHFSPHKELPGFGFNHPMISRKLLKGADVDYR